MNSIMRQINVTLKRMMDDSYPIMIKKDILSEIATIVQEKQLGSKTLIVTDSNIEPLYGKLLLESLLDKGVNAYLHFFEAGEEQKNIATKLEIEKFMFENQFGRDSLILALGGGVVGDIAGFTAATFNRGIPYIQIPTTIVSQVDSSIGGKTAIDVPYGKNLIGAFYQPEMVLIDPMVIKTLPEKEYISGMAEVIKHAVIQDRDLFTLLKENLKAIESRNISFLEEVIEKNCNIKRHVVEKDEKEGNLRKILNFGHTIGHAVEKLMDYQMLHGDCVAIGMIVEAELSQRMGHLPDVDLQEIANLIEQFRLPVKIPGHLKLDDIYEATLLDKKSIGNDPRYSLPDTIGSMLTVDGNYGVKVDKNVVLDSIKKYL